MNNQTCLLHYLLYLFFIKKYLPIYFYKIQTNFRKFNSDFLICQLSNGHVKISRFLLGNIKILMFTKQYPTLNLMQVKAIKLKF